MRETAEHAGGKASQGNELKIGARVRVGRLEDARRARAELGRLYREARQREGRYPTALEANRLANILASVVKSIETVELEERIVLLEGKGNAKS